MRSFRRLLLVLLLSFGLLNVMLAFHAYRFTYFYETHEVPWRRPEDIPTAEKITQALTGFRFGKRPVTDFPGEPFETLFLKNERGQRLEGWYTHAAQPKGTVLLFHGHAANKANLREEQAYFRSLGFNTLAVDFRAHGNSQGNVCTIGYREVGDVKAAYDYVRGRGETRLVLWGVSMGAATLLKALHDFPEIQPDRLILECPFGSMQDAVDGRLRSMNLPTAPFTQLLMLWGSAERAMWGFGYRPTDYARSVRCPTGEPATTGSCAPNLTRFSPTSLRRARNWWFLNGAGTSRFARTNPNAGGRKWPGFSVCPSRHWPGTPGCNQPQLTQTTPTPA